MNETILPDLEEKQQEPKDWVATVRVTDRCMKRPESEFVNSERKAQIGLELRKIERAADEETDLTADVEHVSLTEELAALTASEHYVTWEDDVEADGFLDEKEVEIMTLYNYHKTWNRGGRLKYRGEPRYLIEVLNINEKLIQVPKIALP